MPFLSPLPLVLLAMVCAVSAALGAVFTRMHWRAISAESAARERACAELRAATERELAAERARGEQMRQENARLGAELSAARTALDGERKQTAEKIALLQEARDGLSLQFRDLANRILEEKTRSFTEQNQAALTQVIEPFRVRLHEFKQTVEKVYVDEGKDRTALKTQVEQLMQLNRQLSTDATNLTRALRGENKTQGNWGELVLERILESAGLRKGEEYEVQTVYTRDDKSRAQPDVIVRLPEGKRLVIDSKVSLVDYNDHVNAQEDEAREAACARHLNSMRAHIRGLGEKRYQALPNLETLDFVIMFVPIEPAFLLAIGRDANLWSEAWQKNVLLVSPSTLLFVVRTVAHLWRQEQQTRHVQEIAKKGGELYDKFTAFVGDLSKLGERLKQAQDSYAAAFGKLSSGRLNLITQAERLRDLGASATKSLPAELVRAAIDENMHLDIAAMAESSRN